MRALITLLFALSALAVPTVSAFASGSSRFALDQHWKRSQQWQKHQEQHFDALESEAAKVLKRMDGKCGNRETSPKGK